MCRPHPRVVSSSTAFRALQSWSLERDGHLTDASQVVANPRISEGLQLSYPPISASSAGPLHQEEPHDEEHVMRIFTPALDIGSHINAPRSAAGAALPSDSDWATGLRSAAVPPAAWVGTGAVPHGPFPPSPPPNRAGGLSPHTAFQESTFLQAACWTARVLRVPFTACPPCRRFPCSRFWTPASSGRERLPTIPSRAAAPQPLPFPPYGR